jgi:hypothetical protein
MKDLRVIIDLYFEANITIFIHEIGFDHYFWVIIIIEFFRLHLFKIILNKEVTASVRNSDRPYNTKTSTGILNENFIDNSVSDAVDNYKFFRPGYHQETV